ncbi:hypothetical protein MTR80_06245 [Alcaligenes aquatilis]|uniref:Uncharacterized protein n=1 Tax=Alcaligenes aquatilis TaxID=323284 RepID=A0ABY4NJY4_9BURK|nr:hypothetical protein [Alcaligenes aquatilis]UQN37302.1 hypothetical protein MTR80_06245 [Alcaligenes aquatilis]
MDEYIKLVPCPEGCKVHFKGTEWKQRKGEDYDSYFFDVVDAEGNVVGEHEVRNSTSMYPPIKTTVYLHK